MFWAQNKQCSLIEILCLILIRNSQFFDEKWYLQQYSDVAQLEIDPAFHYSRYGGFEGRNPGPSFSSNLYLQMHPELLEKRVNPLIHYLRYQYPTQSKRRPVLFLHIGLHKTGTSAIQKFLRANENLLLKKHVYYPLDELGGDAHHGFASKFIMLDQTNKFVPNFSHATNFCFRQLKILLRL